MVKSEQHKSILASLGLPNDVIEYAVEQLSMSPPEGCETRFKVGDRVIYTNSYGVVFGDEGDTPRYIIGFSKEVNQVRPNNFIMDCSQDSCGDAFWFDNADHEFELYEKK